MASATNGYTNGVNGTAHHAPFARFSGVPEQIDVPVGGSQEEAVSIDLIEQPLEEQEIEELCGLLESENAARNYWITIALSYVKTNHADVAIDILKKALDAMQQGRVDDRLSILTCLCWLYLWKCRKAPRVKPTQGTEDERTKDYWLAQATSSVNEASKLNPGYAPLYLARGTLSLLKASLQQAGDRAESLRQAAKCFDDAYMNSGNKNLMAILGKAKTQFTNGKYAEAYILYQQVLERAPDMIDPDPRIGIGCCLWQMGHKDIAKEAWERSLQLNENSKIANILLGLYYLDVSSHFNSNDPEFASTYRKAMTTYTQTAFKLDDMHALTCSTFGGYFLLRKTWANVERLARRAIEHTDVNAIASDGWYLLARKDHYEGDLTKAQEHYSKADQARGGDEKGYLPAKFGVAQLKTLMQDYDGAKFRLEKIVSNNKSVEAMTLLGILHAEDVFTSQASASKEDKSVERKKAIGLLEQVRVAWKDAKRKIPPDSAVLLNLARLYEADQPDKAQACLLQVEQMELDEISEEDLPEEYDDEAAIKSAKRKMLSPQLLNNIGCFHFQAEKYPQAREYFQVALESSVSIGNKDSSVDVDSLVSSISFNLARTYEAEGIEDEAEKIYQSLLQRHPDYIDAKARMAYLALRSDPAKGADALKQLLDSDPSNLEVRALYGWYLHRKKKRTLQLQEDQEQRHFKHTLMTYDKHDIYSLTGMGNMHMAVAREMPRDTDQHKERRSKTYMRAVEFYDKVLTLDPRNAFAAQGMGIAMVEEKKDTTAAIQIFSKVRESVKDASVHINLGHVFCELKQFSRSIENYELALQKSREKDAQILACLGRAWLMRGRAEKQIEHYKQSLDFSRQALEMSPESINFKFNVAFVQIQIAQQMIQQPEANKTLEDVEVASKDLDDAIESFIEIARSPQPPFPKNDIEQRANMGRNTMKRQLAAAKERQAEYEQKNATRLEEARARREEEVRRREEEKRIALEKAEEEKRKIREERERIMEEDRQLIARRLEEEKAREEAEYTTDPETGDRKKREKKVKEKRSKRKKKGDDTDTDADGLVDGTGDEDAGGRRSKPRSRLASTTGSDGEAPRKKKKRRLERKGTAVKNSKYKSAEMIEDSDEDDDAGLQPAAKSDDAETPGAASSPAPDDTMADGGDEDEDDAVARPSQRKKQTRVLDDEDEDEDGAPATTNGGDVDMGEEDDAVAAGQSDHGGD
ncbi:Tetratricopeptide repeat 1 [Lecanosticta acicola]|uniref:Tetratricopeptide repeat 1 n=1 Tax=Lecanosticta acicola TaxID=111012 RepID=A0AAI9ECI9_9PEZI|nr:Tetratricopeptide repeat 1 [Lecanosticta acicola]